MKTIILSFALLLFATPLCAQLEEAQIRATLQDYLQGTSNHQPERIKKAFDPQASLYLSKKDEPIWLVPSEQFANWFDPAKKGSNKRVGKILNIEQDGTIAWARAEILMGEPRVRYIDLFLLKKIEGQWKILSKAADRMPEEVSGKRILFVLTSAQFHGSSSIPTGSSFAEIVNAYQTFMEAGYSVDFVSPQGGAVPLAYINTSDPIQKESIYDAGLMYALEHTMHPKEVKALDYAAIHFVGGGGAMYTVPENQAIQDIAMTIYEQGQGIVSSVCHGTAGIVHLKNSDGSYLVSGKTVSGYPDSYEKQDREYFKQFPFLIQATIEQRGGTFLYSDPNTPHVEVDGRLVTGQNYKSSKPVAEAIIQIIEANNL